MDKAVLKLNRQQLEELHQENSKLLSQMLNVKPENIEKNRRAFSRTKGADDPDNFTRALLTQVSCRELNAKKVLGRQDIKSCKVTRGSADGIRAIFLCDHPLAEDSIRDNFHVAEVRYKSMGSQSSILAMNTETSSIIFRNDGINRESRACNIANEAAHQILNSRTTRHNGELYRNIFHFRARGPDLSPETPNELLSVIQSTVPKDLASGISFSNRIQLHELISDCASVCTNHSEVEGIINNAMTAPTNPVTIEAYKQTNTFAARQAVRYLVSLPPDQDQKIREAALILLRARIKDGYFKETPFIKTEQGKIHPADLVTVALGEEGQKFIQQQYHRLGRSLIESIVRYNTN